MTRGQFSIRELLAEGSLLRYSLSCKTLLRKFIRSASDIVELSLIIFSNPNNWGSNFEFKWKEDRIGVPCAIASEAV